MKWLLAVMVSACVAQSPEALERELDSVARVASVMVDGDVCQRIVTKRALASILEVNPRDKWLAQRQLRRQSRAFHSDQEDAGAPRPARPIPRRRQFMDADFRPARAHSHC